MALRHDEVSHGPQDDRDDHEDGFDSSGRQSPAGDQERELLLKEYDDEESFELRDRSDKHEEWTPPKKSYLRRFTSSKTTIILTALFTLALAIALAAFVLRDQIESLTSRPLEPKIRPPQDYVLDSNWDFSTASRRREYTWVVEDKEFNPDGVYRPMMLINGMFPGPLIECNEGDTIVVHVKNRATNATSFHWHGIYQNGTNWMDGTVGITQCGIAPGTDFTYDFRIEGQTGTYWYHGHHGVQASDGLVGPLVVHSKNEKELQKVPYSTDRVVMVQDHYYDPSGALLMQYLAPDRENAEPVPDGALINGRNVRNCDDVPSRRCDNATSTRFEISLEPEKNHRLRIINVGAFAEFQMQIDEHQFAVTEVDGTDVWPEYYHRLNINPAQRYSMVVTANVTTENAYWLRARMITHCFAEDNPEMAAEAHGIIRYTSASPLTIGVAPTSKDWPEVIELECHDMNTTDLHPVVPVEAPAKADDLIYLRSNFEIGAWRLSRGFFNSSSWRAPTSSPTLQRFVNGITSSNVSFTESLSALSGVNSDSFSVDHELVYQTTGIRTIDMIIQNFDDGNHPMHLHGYKYWVLAQGHGYPPADLMDTIDLSNPLRRDTASVEAFGWLLIRFVADNAGFWAFHCHISWHTEAGLLMQFLTRADEVASWTLPSTNERLCMIEGHDKGNGPDDSIWVGS